MIRASWGSWSERGENWRVSDGVACLGMQSRRKGKFCGRIVDEVNYKINAKRRKKK